MRLNLKKIANPYTAFSMAWLLCLILYALGWSGLFPPLSTGLLVFLSIGILVYFITGVIFNKLPSAAAKLPLRFNYKILFVVNVILYISNFAYSGIPLVTGTRLDDFGIPTIIVVATTLNCFTSVYCFYLFLLTRQKRLFIYILACFVLFVMSFSRGNILMSMVTMFFLWVNIKLPTLNFKKLLVIVTAVLLIMYVFGVAGNFRLNNDIGQSDPNFDTSYSSDVILGLGQATDSFKDSPIPGEFFWAYLYTTSPLSNLQFNINKNKPGFSLGGMAYIFIDEFLFDVASKRIDAILGRERPDPDLIVEQLTVPTTLAGSYNYDGYIGMAFIMILFWIFPFIYQLIVAKNPMGIIGISTLCTIYLFSIFDNMFILSGLSFQILYPIIFDIADRIKFNKPDVAILNKEPAL